MISIIKKAKFYGSVEFPNEKYQNTLNCCTNCRSLNSKKEYFCTEWKCLCHKKLNGFKNEVGKQNA